MARTTAIKTLASDLVKRGHTNFVESELRQDYLLENCNHVPGNFETTVRRSFETTYRDDNAKKIDGAIQDAKGEMLKKVGSAHGFVNYVFLKSRHHPWRDSSFDSYHGTNKFSYGMIVEVFLTPFSIIGEYEADILKSYYGIDCPKHIEDASETLKIDLNVNYPHLFESEPDKFKEYFSRLDDGRREKVMKTVIDSNKRNIRLEEWLSEGFPDITEKISRDHYMKDD